MICSRGRETGSEILPRKLMWNFFSTEVARFFNGFGELIEVWDIFQVFVLKKSSRDEICVLKF